MTADLGGTSTAHGETVPLIDGTADGDHLTWNAAVTVPFPLTLRFDVTVSDDEMTGQVTAGHLPQSSVEGRRA
nr:hypothetical protein [Lentzea guizhouensis]